MPEPLARLVEKARRDWLAAQNEFNFVTDPQLIDHAIFSMQAAERRYVYLLRLAARECSGGSCDAAERGARDARRQEGGDGAGLARASRRGPPA